MRDRVDPSHWAGHALLTALALVVAGWGAGLVGALWCPQAGLVLGTFVVCFGGAVWAVGRIGESGLAAAFMGLVAAIGMSIEGHHAVVARMAPIVELPGLSFWDPRSATIGMHVAELRHLRKQESWATVRTTLRGRVSSQTTVVTPLYDIAERRVVGFHCRSGEAARRKDGRWALSTSAWSGDGPVECDAGVKRAIDKCAEASLAVGPGATERFVEVFASESELRQAHHLRVVALAPAGFFAAYAVFVLLYRRRGAGTM